MKRTGFLASEDNWANLLGGFLLLVGLIIFFAIKPADLDEQHREYGRIIAAEQVGTPYTTLAYYDALEAQESLKLSSTPVGKFLRQLTAKPGSWAFVASPTGAGADSLAYWQRVAAERYEYAAGRENSARLMQWENGRVSGEAEVAVREWRLAEKEVERLEAQTKPGQFRWWAVLLLFIVFALLFGLAVRGTGSGRIVRFWYGFAGVFALALLSYWLAGNQAMKTWGVGYAVWGIGIGLLIGNTIGTPAWMRPALRTELFIKTGLVLLGAEILFNKILAIGAPGIVVAWVVTPIVLLSTYWFGQKVLKIKSKTLNIVISADMSVCGVSAAVATAAAARAKREELTLAIGMSMIFTSIMMIVMPLVIRWLGLSAELGGAWLGGTLDATGAVVAAGAFLGDDALNVAATIKMIQNVLIGVIAFAVAVYFSRQEQAGQRSARIAESGSSVQELNADGTRRVHISEIWKRFPRFILGFLGASVLFSVIYVSLHPDVARSVIDQGVIRGFTKNLRGWMFALAFVSIGLSTNFRALSGVLRGGKPLLLYVCGQTLNLLLTLGVAYLMFEVVFK